MTRLVSKHAKLLSEWFRFAIVGICATLTYLTASLAGDAILREVYWANLIGYLSSVAVSYLGHAHVTFRSTQPHRVQGPKFLAVSLMTFGLTNLIVFVAVDMLDQSFLIASIAVACSIPLVTWFLSRIWVFRTRQSLLMPPPE